MLITFSFEGNLQTIEVRVMVNADETTGNFFLVVRDVNVHWSLSSAKINSIQVKDAVLKRR